MNPLLHHHEDHELDSSSHEQQEHLVFLMNELPRISDAAKNLLAEELAKGSVEPAEGLAAVQQVLKAVRAIDMADPIAWGKANPQEGSGMKRMEDIARYKAALILWKKALQSNQSPSKLLGKSFLKLVWKQVREKVLSADADNVTNQKIIQAFEASLFTESEVDVVWTTDLNAALAMRRKLREEKVADRMKQMEHSVSHTIVEMLEENDDEQVN